MKEKVQLSLASGKSLQDAFLSGEPGKPIELVGLFVGHPRFHSLFHSPTESYETLLANDIVNRMKIMQQPSLADQDAMPSVRNWSGVFCPEVSGSKRHQCAPG